MTPDLEIIALLCEPVSKQIVGRKEAALGPFPKEVKVESEEITQHKFDIQDCKTNGNILCSTGAPDRAATYLNGTTDSPFRLCFIKYEEFINQFRLSAKQDWAKGIKRVDYLVYTKDTSKHFILHEVSIGKIESKQSDAKNQFIGTLQFLRQIPEMKDFIDSYEIKRCFVSAKGCDDLKPTPMGIANAFQRAYRVLPNPSEIIIQPLKNIGFTVWKGNIVELK